MWLFAALVAVPLIEIALFIQVGGWIGLWPTLAIVILTAVLGTYLVRSQGQTAMNNVRQSFSGMSNPSQPLADGAMILFAAALLLTPGFFTDAVGFALLTPPIRAAIFKYASKHVKVASFHTEHGVHPDQPRRPQDTVIDGEFSEIPTEKSPNHPGSGWTRH